MRSRESWEIDLCWKVKHYFKDYKSLDHSWEHIHNVVENVKIIACVTCPNFLKASIMAAYLHDIGRRRGADGKSHALMGARIASKYLTKDLSEKEKESIVFAIAHHADRTAPNGGYPVTTNYSEIKKRRLIERVIASVWDADRLEIVRTGCLISKRYLSTSYAKQIADKFNRVMRRHVCK